MVSSSTIYGPQPNRIQASQTKAVHPSVVAQNQTAMAMKHLQVPQKITSPESLAVQAFVEANGSSVFSLFQKNTLATLLHGDKNVPKMSLPTIKAWERILKKAPQKATWENWSSEIKTLFKTNKQFEKALRDAMSAQKERVSERHRVLQALRPANVKLPKALLKPAPKHSAFPQSDESVSQYKTRTRKNIEYFEQQATDETNVTNAGRETAKKQRRLFSRINSAINPISFTPSAVSKEPKHSRVSIFEPPKSLTADLLTGWAAITGSVSKNTRLR